MKTCGHSGMKLTITTAALGVGILLSRQSAAQTITDGFTDASNWGTPFAESGKNLVVTNGRMNFISSTTAGGGGGIARNTPFLATTQDWSIKVDVHVNPFVITNEDHGVSVFLGVGKSSDWLGTHVLLGFDRDWWDPDFYGVNDDVQVNGSSVPGFFNINFLPSSDATLRLDYSAANQTITYYCDSDGSVGGGGWTTLGTTNIASGSYNLLLAPSDTLSLILAGWAEGHVVTNGQAYLDNLEITVVDTGSLQVTISPTDAVSAGAQWQVDAGAWQDSGNTVSNLSVGSHTVAYRTIPAWNTPSSQTVVVSARATTVTNGVYTPQTGTLQVSISPAGAITAGAQWQVDGGAWQNSGNTVSNLTVGNHAITYKPVSDWNTPGNQTVFVTAGATTLTNGIYTPQTGSLQVSLSPAGAISAGAQWQVDGGAWQNSGATVSSLTVGNHTVGYKTIPGWNTPTNQTVLVVASTTTATNGVYVQQTGSLLVTIDPASAVTAGAQWQVDGGAWQNSGAVINGLAAGNYTVSFKNIPDWVAPGPRLVVVVPNSTATANGVYASSSQSWFPVQINCSLQGGDFTMSYLSYPVVPGQTYILQYTDDLTPPRTWRPLMPLTTSPITVATGVSSTRYFRCIRVGDSFPADYSLNIVGYVRRSIQPGLNLVANPLNSCGDNSIGSLFPNCPPNSEILLPDPSGSLVPGSVFSGGAWDRPNLNLIPGQGIGLVNPETAFEVTFAGEVVQGAVTSIPPGLALIGSKVPVNGLLNFPAQDWDEITTWNATNQTSLLHDYFGGSWYPESPAIGPAEAFWVQVSQFTQWTQPFEPWSDSEVWDFPLMTRQPASRTNSPGSTAHFAVQAMGGWPLHYQWRKNGTNLLAAERILGVNADTLVLTNVQSADAGNYSVVITNFYGSVTSSVATLTVQVPAPLIITTNGSVGVSNGLFGFSLSGASGQTVVTEASTNLANPVWLPLQTNVLDGSPAYFSDPQWTNYPGRYYRLRSQ